MSYIDVKLNTMIAMKSRMIKSLNSIPWNQTAQALNSDPTFDQLSVIRIAVDFMSQFFWKKKGGGGDNSNNLIKLPGKNKHVFT